MPQSASQVYTPAVMQLRRIRFRTRNDLRFWSDEDLKDHVEFLQRERVYWKTIVGAFAVSNVEWCECRLMELLTELDRRKKLARRFRNDPLAPRWSNAGSQRRADLAQLAQELKRHWQIDRFLTQILRVDLFPTGHNRWKCRCVSPDHEDRNPSMVVFGDSQHVHCFAGGCEYHGDVLDLAGLHFGLTTFRDTVERLADATFPDLAKDDRA